MRQAFYHSLLFSTVLHKTAKLLQHLCWRFFPRSSCGSWSMSILDVVRGKRSSLVFILGSSQINEGLYIFHFCIIYDDSIIIPTTHPHCLGFYDADSEAGVSVYICICWESALYHRHLLNHQSKSSRDDVNVRWIALFLAFVFLMIQSTPMTKTNPDMTHSCFTPRIPQLFHSPSITQLLLLSFIFLMMWTLPNAFLMMWTLTNRQITSLWNRHN